MMDMRRTMAAVLSAALLCTGGLAAIAAEDNQSAQDAPASEQQQQLSIIGKRMEITALDLKSGEHSSITAQEVLPETVDGQAQADIGVLPVQLNLSADTVYLDTQTGLAVNADALKVGDQIFAYYSAAQTRSIPPQSAAYAIVTNLDEKASPAHYLVAEEVTENKDGSVTVLAENGTMLVTVGKDTPITPLSTKDAVKNTDLQTGMRFFAWYDQVALSMPGQAQATKAVLLPNASDTAQPDDTQPVQKPLAPGETLPYRYGVQAAVTDVSTRTEEGDMVYMDAITVKTQEDNARELVCKIGEHTVFLDSATGLPADIAALKKGALVYVYYGDVMTASEPAQVAAEAVLVNLPEKQSPAHMLTAEKVTRNADGSVTLLADNGSILVTVGKDTPIAPYRTRDIVKTADIRMGSTVFAWYDQVALSMPGQAQATKVVLLPAQEREVTMVHAGDIAIGSAKIENGVVMVPLRLAAETLGFTVTWNGDERSIHLTDGTRQTTVRLGMDSYWFAAAQEGLIGMSSPVALGAAAYEEDGASWVPAELFNLLVDGAPVSLHADVLYI